MDAARFTTNTLQPPLEALAARLESEYREMPGLSLTLEQASRLCGIETAACELVLRHLVAAGVLFTSRNRTYVAAPPTRD